MPSSPHVALLELFRTRPILAAELLRDALNAPIPEFESVRVSEADLTTLAPTEYHADLVLLLEPTGGGSPCGAVIVEAQLHRSSRKRWSWPAYVTGLRARLRCQVALLVVTNDPVVARWAARPISIGHPGLVFTPLVLGPGNVPLLRDEAEALRAPDLAVLSVVLNAKRPNAAELAAVALSAARQLDAERASLYFDLVFASVQGTARLALEALMAAKNYEYQSDFAKRYFGQGKAEGKAQSVLAVLSARGIDVPDNARARILECTDIAQLDAWLARAVTASAASDVVRAFPATRRRARASAVHETNATATPALGPDRARKSRAVR
jgi:hypothetical protein